jgi:hypothetical protein
LKLNFNFQKGTEKESVKMIPLYQIQKKKDEQENKFLFKSSDQKKLSMGSCISHQVRQLLKKHEERTEKIQFLFDEN